MDALLACQCRELREPCIAIDRPENFNHSQITRKNFPSKLKNCLLSLLDSYKRTLFNNGQCNPGVCIFYGWLDLLVISTCASRYIVGFFDQFFRKDIID
jgi:hypothetical protein